MNSECKMCGRTVYDVKKAIRNQQAPCLQSLGDDPSKDCLEYQVLHRKLEPHEEGRTPV